MLLCIQLSNIEMRDAIFQPTPSELVFKNYVPNETYELPFSLRNTDKVGPPNTWFYKVLRSLILSMFFMNILRILK